MNRQMFYAGALLALGLAACSDDRNSGPSAPDLKPSTSTCNYSTLKQYARNLFGSPSAGYDLAQAISGETPGTVAATELGFDIFAEIARVRDAATTAAPFTAQNVSDGANLVVQTIGCSNVTTGPSTLAAFTSALGPNGAWAVRAGSVTTTTPVVTADLLSGVSAPGNDFDLWINGPAGGSLPRGRAVFYGYPITPFAGGELTGAAAGIQGNSAYEWSLIRASYISQSLYNTGPNGKGKLTICVTVDDNVDQNQLRIEHLTDVVHDVSNILETRGPVNGLVCSPGAASLSRVHVGLAALPIGQRMVRLTTRLLSPTPLYAAALVGKSGSPTGSAGSFSPHNAANPVDVTISFAKQPSDGRVSPAKLPTFKVLAVGSEGSPWEGVLIQVFAFNNNGQFVTSTNDQATTGSDGLAVFDSLKINKTGGYKLLAVTVSSDPDVANFVPDSTISNKFNVRP